MGSRLIGLAALLSALTASGALAQAGKVPLAPGAQPPAAGGSVSWTAGQGGAIPSGAQPTGYDAGGFLFSCRATAEGGSHPGKVRPGIGGCFVPIGGREVSVAAYEVLMGSDLGWAIARDGTVPPGAVEAGRTRTNQPLYVCRSAAWDGRSVMLVPGKVGAGLRGCNVGYSEREVTQAFYEVLVRR